MKELLQKYYKIDNKTKEILPFLYMYDELLDELREFNNIEINNIYEEQLLMEIIIKCWYSTNLDPTEIIIRLLSIINRQKLKINDLKNIEIDELKKMLEYEEQSDIIDEFEYNGYYCVLCKSEGKFLLIIDDGRETDVISFDSLKYPLTVMIKHHITEKCLYKGNMRSD